MFQLFFIIFLQQMCLVNSQWSLSRRFLFQNQIFQEAFGETYYYYPFYYNTSSFMIPMQFNRTANFISCINPNTSYITLNQTYPEVQFYGLECEYYCYNCQCRSNYLQKFSPGFLSFDLYFQGTWNNGKVIFSMGSFSNYYEYNSPSQYSLNKEFCDDIYYDIKTVNFTIPYEISGNFKFTIENQDNSGQVSIRNIYNMYYSCHFFCKTCTGPQQNQCTSCYYGTPINSICPLCPQNQYYVKYVGCRSKCDSIQPLCLNGVCNKCPTNFTIGYAQVNQIKPNDGNSYKEYLQWSKIYDPDFINDSVNVLNHSNQSLYGIFNYNSGIMRSIPISNNYGYYLKVRIFIVVFNEIPLDCGIQFKFNNTYVGSIFKNSSGVQLHQFKEFSSISLGPYNSYQSSIKYQIDGFFDLPKQPILFTAIGNFSDSSSGWAFQSIQFTTNSCTDLCNICDVNFKCKQCSNSYRYRDGTCIQYCNRIYQKVVVDYCKDFDDETPYSQLLIKEDLNQFELDYTKQIDIFLYYPEYTLVQTNGSNFLKGSDRYFSYWEGQRILGGQFIWAQARFRRVFQNINPHHSISIGFYVLFGPSFPPDGLFIYQIEQEEFSTTLGIINAFQNGTRQKIITNKVNHSLNILTLELQCYGPNNDVTLEYCGLYNFYLAIHYCQPFCLECIDDKNCTLWNSTYDSSLIQFSKDECESNQYFNEYQFLCVDCESRCTQCISKLNCSNCQHPSYSLTQFGCFCKQNQYEESNQCFDCPKECNQCLSSTYCTECLSINNRKLSNGSCPCINGYYQKDQEVICLLCNKFCGNCFGPSSNDCLNCNVEIENIQLINSTCKCPNNSFYDSSSNRCTFCNQNCLTCFNDRVDGCLTCDSQLNKQIKGLKCECKSGYYLLDNICIQCPINIDVQLLQCYKYCNNGEMIWHNTLCENCGQGFNLISNECIPICGDLQIVGYEQCDDGNTILNDKCFNCQYQCPISCVTCDISTILPCDVCGDGFIGGDEECEDGNDIQFDGCYNCKYQCQNECTKCIKGECSECATKGWQLDVSTFPWVCKEICGDGYKIGIEECDDANFRDSDSCDKCKFLCRKGCSFCDYQEKKCLSCEYPGFKPQDYYCVPISNDGLLVFDPYGFYYEAYDGTAYYDAQTNSYYNNERSYFNENGDFKCQPIQCINCLNQKCLACKAGQELQDDNICKPKCQDSIKAENEYCEDSFNLPYRGCQNCQPKCQNSCDKCDTRGKGCLKCKEEYSFNDYLCYSKCGNMLIMYEKECDDENLIYDDGCHFCLLICQKSCLTCINGVCQDCQNGYQLIQSRCYEIFNIFDKIVYSNNIDHFIQIDKKQKRNVTYGWHDIEHQLNKYKEICRICYKNCEICNEEFCLTCFQGYYLNEQYECKSQCGDGILTQDEQCEVNDISCFNCVFIKPQNCQEFFNHIQIYTQYGYYFDQFKSQCISQCGYGICIHNEECDSFEKNCVNCKSQCGEYCLKCKEGFCLQCEESYHIQNGQCLRMHQLVQEELTCKLKIFNLCLECHDQFILDSQGKCQQSCQDSCILCKFGLCYECKEQYYLNLNNCYLKTQCSFSLYLNLGFQEFELYCGEQLSNKTLADGFNYFTSLSTSQHIKSLYENYFDLIQQFYVVEEDLFLDKFQKFSSIETIYQIQQDYYDDQIFNINLQELLCNTNCKICLNDQCIECEIGWKIIDFQCVPICGDSLIVGNEQCEDNNLFDYDGCYQCQYQCAKNCQICENGKCIKCILDYNLEYTNECRQIQSLYTVQNHQYDCKIFINDQCILCQHGKLESTIGICTINNIIQSFENCQIQVNQKCTQCKQGYFGLNCLDGDGVNFPIDRCGDQNQQQTQICKQYQQCDQNCLYCVNQICYLCNQGSFLFNNQCILSEIDQFKYISQIKPKCGDGLIQIFEECDDRNLDQISNCYNCKISCFPECLFCSYGICQACKEGYILNQKNQCETFCGDKIIVPYSKEQCDDGNTQDLDGCSQCKIECTQFCLFCNNVFCLKCEEGFFIQQSQCQPICGDGIVIQDFEECDDYNDEPYDGCFQCQFQCRKNCKLCSKGICLDECPQGMVFFGDICIEKPCIQNCQICELGYCFQCNPEYSYDDENNLCIKNKKTENTSLQILKIDENFWICREFECVYSPAPIMLVNYLNKTFTKQYIGIQFDQQVKFKFFDEDEQDQLIFQFMFTNLKEEQYKINLNSTQAISQNLSFVQYFIEIENLVSIDEKPNFFIILKSEIINSYNQCVQNKQVTLQLNQPIVMSDSQRQSSQFMQNTNKVFMYGAISVSILSTFAGDSSFFLETLDVLQQQSYLKFINVEFPENLYIYFEASEMLSVSTYFQKFDFYYYYNEILGLTETNNLEGKFQFYDLDPDIMTSLLPQIFQCTGLLLLLYLCNPLQRLFHQIMLKQQIYDYFQVSQQKIQALFIKLIKLIRLCLKNTISLKINIIIKNFLILNAWDLLFKSFLQVRFVSSKFTRAIFQTIIGTMILCVYGHYILNLLSRKSKTSNKYDSNTNKFYSLDLGRKFIYNFVLIFFQENPTLQILFLLIISITQSFIIFIYDQSNPIQKLISILNESAISLFTGTSLIYIDQNITYVSNETIIKFGFIQMGILLLNLLIVFFKQLLIKLDFILKKVFQKGTQNQNDIKNNILVF
ncbi:unnamed protein product [Paramecium sonneborni]|uniref:EGF-like domain-containing protein n=1 Tax=Paramecium sonneborni TaxID=65129 RepID=A0A8S1LXH8_9CILI|nr:unnamed protein product [Paramecium sonneborni]